MKRLIHSLDVMFHCLTAISFGLVSICVLIQIVTRYTPSISAPWTDEMTRLFFLYTIMFGAPMALQHEEYAVIDIITGNLKGKWLIGIRIFSFLITGIVCTVGTWQAARFFRTGLRTLSTALRINMGVFYLVPVGIFALTLLYCFVGIANEVLKLKKGEE